MLLISAARICMAVCAGVVSDGGYFGGGYWGGIGQYGMLCLMHTGWSEEVNGSSGETGLTFTRTVLAEAVSGIPWQQKQE